MSYMIAREYRHDLDANMVMCLGLFHEVGEIYAGDATPSDITLLVDKVERERQSAQQVFSDLSTPKEYVAIWEEFEAQITPEAVFVKQIDRLDMALQAGLYERRGYNNLEAFFADVQQKLKAPELQGILESLLQTRVK